MSRSFSRAASAKGVGCSVALFLAVPSARRLFRASSTPGTRWREGQECRAAFECVLQSQSAGLRFVPPFLGAPAPHRSALKLYLFFFMGSRSCRLTLRNKNTQTRGLMTNLEGLLSVGSQLRVGRNPKLAVSCGRRANWAANSISTGRPSASSPMLMS